MGGGGTGKGGVADATLNVVPFIDLLACTICFLLISAVWTQMSRIDVDQALPKASPKPPPTPPKPEAKINIMITQTGYLVNLWNADKIATPKPELVTPKKLPIKTEELKIQRNNGAVDKFKTCDQDKLRETLEGYMRDAALDDKTKVMVAADDKVQYIHLIMTLDTILTACKDKEKKQCLKNPSVGDQNLLRQEGFATFD
ncbi:MAG: biopolymer transporter ExbD [Deltaproteobacteria bacterium]|nr:biopolymer transporter ExbD [Deltaproteobacteria bacterium]